MVDEQLFIADDRYSRLRLIAWWDQERLHRAQVLVVGAGALGNEVLKNLALLGVGQVVVVDCDQVELSNLSRSVLFRPQDRGQPKAVVAARAVRDLNPDVHATALPENVLTGVGLGWFRDADVVVGCLDNREARLWVNRACWKLGKPWIDGGIQELNGVVQVFTPPDKACYECGMTEMDYRLIQLRHSCPLLRREDLLSGKVPTTPTIAAVIGGLQTQEALKLLHGLPVAGGEALVFNGVANTSYRTQLPYREDCLSHDPLPPLVELPLSAGLNTAQQLFAAARAYLPTGALRLLLDRDLVVTLECRRCNATVRVLKALPLVGVHDGLCPTCGDWARPALVHAVAADSELAGERLATLGVPPYDIVRVAAESQEHAFLLAADRPPSPEPLFSVDRPPRGRND